MAQSDGSGVLAQFHDTVVAVSSSAVQLTVPVYHQCVYTGIYATCWQLPSLAQTGWRAAVAGNQLSVNNHELKDTSQLMMTHQYCIAEWTA